MIKNIMLTLIIIIISSLHEVVKKFLLYNATLSSSALVEHLFIVSGVARICCEEGQRWKLCHGALTVNFGCSNCSMTNSFVTNAVLVERAVSC